MIIKYILLIIKEFAFQLTSGILAALLIILSLFFPNFLNYFIKYVALYYVLIVILISSFYVWRKEKQKSDTLEQEISNIKHNPVDYKIDHVINDVVNTIDYGRESQFISKEKSFIKFKLAGFNARTHQLLEGFYSMLQNFEPSKTAWEEYSKSLEEYENRVSIFNEEINHTHQLLLMIKNIGTSFDEKINIIIVPLNDCKFYRSAQEMIPTRPERPKIAFESMHDFRSLLNIPHIRNVHAYRNIIDFSEKYIGVELKELRVGESANIVLNPFCIITKEKQINLKIEIKSKNTKSPINKSLQINV